MATDITIELDYGTHKSTEKWFLTTYHCVDCGKQSVWDEHGDGDFYDGTTLTCVDCGATFHNPGSCATPHPLQPPRFELLRKAVADHG